MGFSESGMGIHLKQKTAPFGLVLLLNRSYVRSKQVYADESSKLTCSAIEAGPK